MTRLIRTLLLAALAIACSDDGKKDQAGGRVFTASAGEVALTDGGSLRFSITSERYKQWDAAQRGLDQRITSRFGALLQPASPSQRNIDRAVEYLESEPAAVHAIERAGMSVRDFVVTTVALEQEMRLAGEGSTRQQPMPPPFPMPTDSAYLPDSIARPVAPYPTYPVTPYPVTPYPVTPYPATPSPATPYPATPYPATPVTPRPADTMPRVDTVYTPTPALPPRRDSILPRRDSLTPWRDSTTVRRDTFGQRRDTLASRRDTLTPKRDTTARPKPSTPPPRDTLRDTIPRLILIRT